MSDLGMHSTSKSVRHKRKARNYLLDPRFQLKYTGMLVAVALVLSAVLGVQLWFTSNAVVAQSQRAVEQGRETVQRGQETVTESKRVSQVVAMNIEREYADNPELAKLFGADSEERERAIEAEQKRLEGDAHALEEQAVYLAVQQRRSLMVLVGGLAIFVCAIAVMGIVFTHKIAGPVYRMKILLGSVGRGELAVQSGLRRGDELVSFFGAFRAMVDCLRMRHIETTKRLEQSIETLRGEVAPEKLAPLVMLHEEMAARVQDTSFHSMPPSK